jgi:HlyD family secretion protein
MSGDGEIVTEVVEGAVVVPETALRYEGERVLLDVLDGDGPAVAREVKVGIVDGARVQVVEGATPGERVLVH